MIRRHDLDWLRVIAFCILVFFHTAVLFIPNGVPKLPNEQHSLLLALFVSFFHQFRLGLLFLVSGFGVYYAMRSRDMRAFIKERTRRLVIPLVFGILVLVPPMVYLERLYLGEFSGSYVEFYSGMFISGPYPTGDLSWHHFWFLAYIYLFCLLSAPIFVFWRSLAGKQMLESLAEWLATAFRIYSIIILLIISEIILRPLFPGSRNLVADWASFVHWFIIFLMGYIVASSPKMLDRVATLRKLSLLTGSVSAALLFTHFYDIESFGFKLQREVTLLNALNFVWFSFLRMTMAWSILLACLGFATVHLRKESQLLTYLNRAVYPLFCLHLPVIVFLAYLILPTDLSILLKFSAIVSGTFFICLCLHHFLFSKSRILGPVVGLR